MLEKDHISDRIERNPPAKKNFLPYPFRFLKEDFEKAKQMSENPEIIENFYKWKNGYNFLTGRKIKIGGPTFEKLKLDFYIKSGIGNVLFEELLLINQEAYISETINIISKIDAQNMNINTYNDDIIKIKDDIYNFKNWDNFIEFENIKYGIPHIVDNIHRKNDCMGNIKFFERYESECKFCRDGTIGYGYSHYCSCVKYDVLKCDTCAELFK